MKEKFEDSRFIVEGKNYEILNSVFLSGEIKAGDEIVFISAPYIFGDGYKAPIVAISKKDKIYLDFETGYENLMKQYE